jgi:hypothetical protein
MKRLFLLFLIVFASNTIFANDISVVCTRYRMTITNITDHTLKIYLKKKGRIYESAKIVNANNSFTIEGNFSKRRLKQISIHTKYDSEVYNIDKETIETNYQQQYSQSENYANSQIEASFIKFGSRIAAEEASKIKTNYDDNFLERVLKSIARTGGNITKGAIDGYETVKVLNSNLNKIDETRYKYTNLDELVDDLKNLIKNEKEYAEFIEKGIIPGLDVIARDKTFDHMTEKSKDYYKHSIVFLAQDLVDDVNTYKDNLNIIKNNRQKSLAYINSLLDNNKDYFAYELAKLKGLNLKTITPIVNIGFDPLVYGNRLNSFWGRSSDKILTNSDDNKDQYELGDGLWNKSWGVNLGIASTPEIRIGNRLVVS